MNPPIRVWLTQDVLAPYRIPLFKKIADTPGIDFRLILLSPGRDDLRHWQIDLETLPFAADRLSGFSLNVNYSQQINLSPRFLKRLLAYRPDVVICAGYSFATMQTYAYKILTGKPYVIWMEGTAVTEAGLSPRLLRRWQRRFLTRNAGALIDAGTESHKYLRSLLGRRSTLKFFRAYNAVDNDALDSCVREFAADCGALTVFRDRFPDQNILFVGQLIERKGIHQLLEVYRALLRRRRAPVGLIMLGDGPLEGHLREIKKEEGLDHLYLEGFIGQDVYPKYLAVADLMILPSLHDPNPLVVFEGMAAGKPIILSSRAGNAPDFVEDGKNGFVVDPLAIDTIVDRIADILNATPAERSEMGAQSRKLVQKANYRAAAKAFVDAVHTAVNKGR